MERVFDELASQWLEKKKSEVTPQVLNRYINNLNYYLLPSLGSARLEDITEERITEVVEDLTEKQGMKRNTALVVASQLKQILLYGGIPCPVFPSPKLNEVKPLAVSDEERLKEYLLTPQPVPKSKKSKKKDDGADGEALAIPFPNIGILLSLCMGLKLGEICALTWGDIHLEEEIPYISVNKTMQRIQKKALPEDSSNLDGGVVLDRKNRLKSSAKTELLILPISFGSAIRDIPIPDFLVSVLCDAHQRVIESVIDDAFFLTGTKWTWMEPRILEKKYKEALKTLAMSVVKFDNLRDSCATRMLDRGIDVKIVSEILGHANPAITLKRYNRPASTLAEKKRAFD